MNKPFFSIIIPAHNSETYIRRLLDSIASQSFHNYELIVVCDNCTDNTEQIAREYGARTERVSFGRDGLTRDRGIELAQGEWILFADDDDWYIHEYCFQLLAECIGKNTENVDLVAFGFIFRTRGYTPPSEATLLKARIDHVWSSAWRRDAICGARFGDAVFCSDTYFLKAMKQHVLAYKLLNMPLYYYNFMRKGSQTDLFCKGIIRQSPVAE